MHTSQNLRLRLIHKAFSKVSLVLLNKNKSILKIQCMQSHRASRVYWITENIGHHITNKDNMYDQPSVPLSMPKVSKSSWKWNNHRIIYVWALTLAHIDMLKWVKWITISKKTTFTKVIVQYNLLIHFLQQHKHFLSTALNI